jgi:hypothetical protein
MALAAVMTIAVRPKCSLLSPPSILVLGRIRTRAALRVAAAKKLGDYPFYTGTGGFRDNRLVIG